MLSLRFLRCGRTLARFATVAALSFAIRISAQAPVPPAADAHDNTPLHLAALRNDAAAVDALLDRGANVNALNEAGATALHYGTGSEPIVQALLAHGANRDIKPLIERSCAGCHVGEKIRGKFSLVSRDTLLKGGQSGDPAVVPGRSADSHLVRYISDQVEDLEMPPGDRREKYPALTPDEVALVRAWIDAGANWDK